MMRQVFLNVMLAGISSDEDSMNASDRDALVMTLQEVYGMSRPEAMENAEFLQRSSEPAG